MNTSTSSCCCLDPDRATSGGVAAPAPWRWCAGGFALLLAWALILGSHPAVSCSACSLSGRVLVWHRCGRTLRHRRPVGRPHRRKSGVASWPTSRGTRAVAAMRRRAGTVRPSLASGSRGARLRQLRPPAVVDVAVRLCRAGRSRVWASDRGRRAASSAGRARASRSGSPAASSTRPAPCSSPRPGPTCSTQTAPLRARPGPVFVFNPVGLGGLRVDDHLRPADRLHRPRHGGRARRRHARGRQPRGRQRGSGVLGDAGPPRAHRAAARRRARRRPDHGDVQGWVAEPDARQREITALLRRSAEPALRQDAIQFMTTNDRTQTSITSTIMPALGWLTHDAAAAAATGPRTGGPGSTSARCSRPGRRSTCSAARRPRPRRSCRR